MAFETSRTPKMILQHQWTLGNVEEEPKTIASKMILFRGEKMFRVGLKNHVKSLVLFFIAVDLNKIGMKVEGVMCGSLQRDGIGPAMMWQMTKENIGDNGSLQLFTLVFTKITGNCTLVFRIHLEGSVPGYSYRLSDHLAKDQLWDAAKNKNSVDVEFLVKDETFSAHKAILAARSPVFAAEFAKEEPVEDGNSSQVEPNLKKRKKNNSPIQIRIDGVEPSTVEHFLHFIYTGESVSSLANEELLKLADQFQLKTLANLCQVALKKIETMQMVNITNSLNNTEIPYSSTIKPEKDTEIFFDRTTSTFRCALLFNESDQGKSKCMMTYRNEKFFFGYFTGERVVNPTDKNIAFSKPVIHFLCSKHRRFGLKIEDVYCKQKGSQWSKMESKHFQKNAELLLHFTTQSELDVQVRYPTEVSFDIKIVSNIENFYFGMMDSAWIKDFWFAATCRKFTDVEIFVGTVKLMEAHRIVLSARSPVMNAAFNKISDTGKSIVILGSEFDVAVVENFLKFLYTGSLETSASKSTNYKQLLKLATMYEVETLKNFCQLANHVPDVEEFTNCLLQL